MSAAALPALLAACSSSSTHATSATSATSAGTPSSSVTTAPALRTVTIQLYPTSVDSWLLYLAGAQHFYQKNGINPKYITTGTGAETTAGIAAGSIDVGDMDLTLAGPLIERGHPFQVVIGANVSNWNLVAAPGTQLPPSSAGFAAQLKALTGKTLGVLGLGTSSYYYLRALLQDVGIPPSAVQYTASGSNLASTAAIEENRVAAGIVDPSGAYPLVTNSHLRTIFNFVTPPSGISQYPKLANLAGAAGAGADWALKSWVSANPSLVTAFQLSIMEADVWAHTASNLPQVVADLTTFGLPKLPAGEATAYVKALLPSDESYVPSSTTNAMAQLDVQQGVTTSLLPPAQWVAPGVPTSAQEVTSIVSAHGGA